MKKYIAGVDIGGTGTKLGLFLLNGEPVRMWSIPTETEGGGSSILKNAAASLCGMMQLENAAAGSLAGAGIAVPGAVKDGVHAEVCPNIGWSRKNVAAEFREALRGVSASEHAADQDPAELPVRVMNDASAAAYGEYRKGAGRDSSAMMMVTLGTGVGGAFVKDGHILEGAFGCAGEIGHINVNPDEKEYCSCGRRGCLEQYISAGGIVRTAGKYIASGAETSLPSGEFTSEDIAEAAAAGDELSCRVMRETGFLLGRALALISCVIDPGLFVIGGGVSEAGRLLTEPAVESFRRWCYPPVSETKIVKAELGGNAGVYGCALSLI